MTLANHIPTLSDLFGTGLSQHARFITLVTAQDSSLPESLMVEQFSGREAVNQLFCFDIDAFSASTDLAIDDFLGEEITLKLLLADGSRRAWHGVCTQAGWLGADGGVARYRLRLEPALSLLQLRRDSFIVQDKDVRDIVTELLADYPQLRFEFDLIGPLTVRPVCTQYRASDFDFFTRLLASEGLSWRFEHEQADAAGGNSVSGAQAKHWMVIFDSKAVAPPMPGGERLRFHGVRATETTDTIDAFAAVRQAQPNAVTASSWDPSELFAHAAEQTSNLQAGELPVLAVHDGSGERRYADGDAADRHSERALQAFELDNKAFTGAGAVRSLAAGHRFQLTQHHRYGEGNNRFTVLSVRHVARNNFGSGLARAQDGASEDITYRNTFECVRETIAIVPPACGAVRHASAPGAQTALVVGLPDMVATTVRDHQVKVQFPWQRGGTANSGGLSHNTDDRGNAPGNDASGTWVRVAEALAGPNWGTQFTPRIGTEVLINFIEGDIDRPIVVAQLYTGDDLPPYSAGVDSNANHAGVLSGLHSHNFDGAGYNQWQLDDTPGQLRMRLATSTAATQLNLGYLIQQPPASAQRGNYRGSGFEMRTDAWAMVRGGEGVLISTTARWRQGSSVTSTQLDAAEAVGNLKAAKELAKVLAEAAIQQSALASKDANTAQEEFIANINVGEKGKYDGSVGGQSALKSSGGSREIDPASPVEKFASPMVMLEAPSTINWASPASTVVYAGEQLHWTTQADLHFSAAHTIAAVAANAAVLFTHSGGIQAFAGNGPLSLQAHTAGLEILADKAVTVLSVNDAIEIKAKQKIVLQAGQSAITLEGGNITFACPGNFTVKGGQHLFDSGASKPGNLSRLPDAAVKKFDEAFVLRGPDGEPMPNVDYYIDGPDGRRHARTDENGLTERISTDASDKVAFDVEWFRVKG